MNSSEEKRCPEYKVPLSSRSFDDASIDAVLQTMKCGNLTMGKKVRAFESVFEEIVGSNHAIMCNSGSSANTLAFSALLSHLNSKRIQVGTEVIVPAVSWATTVWPIIQLGLIPVIVDVCLNTYNIDSTKIEEAITQKTSAIIVVHTLGNPCSMNEIVRICNQYKLHLIEDCCEATGAIYNNLHVGNFGEFGTFSFYFAHHLSTIEGGIIVTNQFNLSEIIRLQRAHGRTCELQNSKSFGSFGSEQRSKFIFIDLGYNFKPTEIQAALGQLELQKLPDIIAKRENNAKHYLSNLVRFQKHAFFQECEKETTQHSWFWFSFLLKQEDKIDKLIKYLESAAIETRPIIAGNIARQPALKDYKHVINGSLDNADYIMKNGVALAVHEDLSKMDLAYVIETLENFF